MTEASKLTIIKIVYFDEESASDYLDISAGGKENSTSEQVRNRTKETHTKVEAGLMAKLSWLPFLGVSGELSAGAGASAAGSSILSKTLSNTILTDYLTEIDDDPRIEQLRGLTASASKDSMAYLKMFTPYMIAAKTEDQGVDLARLDEALAGAKGYYELIGKSDNGSMCVLRFNIRAFRNNYGLTDLGRMNLVFHGILVGSTAENDLGITAEMAVDDGQPLSACELVDGRSAVRADLLDVYDVVLAGVEHGG